MNNQFIKVKNYRAFFLNEAVSEFKTTITNPETGEENFDVTVEFDYRPGQRGGLDKYGKLSSPDVDAEIEILSIKDKKGNDYMDKLSDEDLDSIRDEINKDSYNEYL